MIRENFAKKQIGMTLLEVVVVIALIGILLIPIGELLISGTRMVIRAEERTKAKDFVLIIEDYIFDRVKFASKVEFDITTPAIGSGVHSISMDARGLVYQDGTSEKVVIAKQLLEDLEVELGFSKSTDKTVKIEVKAKKNEGGILKTLYSEKTSIKCINMPTADVVPNATGSVIRYWVP